MTIWYDRAERSCAFGKIQFLNRNQKIYKKYFLFFFIDSVEKISIFPQ